MIDSIAPLININWSKTDTTPKKIFLCAILLASDRVAISLCYNILKMHQIPLDICTKPLPSKVWTLFDQIVMKISKITSTITIKTQSSIQYLFPSFDQLYQKPLKRILIGPICEEFLFRLVLQEIFLRKIPRLILTEKGHLVELKRVKVVRIILSSTLFALFHTQLWGQGYFARAGINAQFIGGISLGIMTEQTQGILYSTFMHVLHNLSVGSTG
ncbi:MAG: CPBP family intramembrane metalloprotease [Parachlamydiaceae bacterium]|nr:CPBP family intramembrane metalloprotease [Parachlamydiaceae bacterium]